MAKPVQATKTALSGFVFAAAGDTDAAKSLNYTLLHEAMNTLALNTNGITKRVPSLLNKFLMQWMRLLIQSSSLFAVRKVALWMS